MQHALAFGWHWGKSYESARTLQPERVSELFASGSPSVDIPLDLPTAFHGTPQQFWATLQSYLAEELLLKL